MCPLVSEDLQRETGTWNAGRRRAAEGLAEAHAKVSRDIPSFLPRSVQPEKAAHLGDPSCA